MNNVVYLTKDCYTMAKERIRHVIDIYDDVICAFSGGKDSLAVINLVDEVYKELGIKSKVKVFFRDEELIPNSVINFVDEIYKSGRFDFRYYAIPLKSTKYILGDNVEYVQFDPNRVWLRQPPSYAITLPRGDNRVFTQYESDEFICKDLKGKVAIFTGIRASESLIRYRSCVNKKNDNYINATKSKGISLVKPIYDWQERDVFLYFYLNKINYSRIYDDEMFNNENLRVSTPLHAESSKRFYNIRTRDPVFYQQLIELFPEMLVQEKYYKQYQKGETDFQGYEHSEAGLYKYIQDTISDSEQRKLALKRVKTALQTRANNMANGEYEILGAYPLRHLFNAVKTVYKNCAVLEAIC